jgi:hypothetical protein
LLARASYQGDNDFTVRVSLKVVGLAEVLAKDLVVVDFTVDGESDAAILVEQGLSTRVWKRRLSEKSYACLAASLHTNTDDTQTLVDQDSVVGDVVATPIGTTVTDLLAHAQGSGLELLHIGMAVALSISGESRGTRSELPRGIGTHLWQAKIPHILGNELRYVERNEGERQSVPARKMNRRNQQPVDL